VCPEQFVQGLGCGSEGHGGAGIRDRRLDLAAMPDDSFVAQQAFDVVLGKPGNAVGIEVLEGVAKSLALTQDREP